MTSSPPAIQWAGPLLIIGAFLVGLSVLLVSREPVVGQPLRPWLAGLILSATVLLLLAMPAVYARQAVATGWLGLVAHALLSIGLLLPVVVAATPLLHPSISAPSGEHPVLFLLRIALTLGLLLTGAMTLQAGVFPRPAAILVLGAAAGFFAVFFVAEFLPASFGQIATAIFATLLAVGLGWIGVALWIEG